MADHVEYILGHAPSEARRLALQAEIARPVTERMLRAAGLSPGMRVLDIGCGIGDVAMLAAGIVGPGGAVVGVDRDESIVKAARERAAGAGLPIEFRQAQAEDCPELGTFDLAVGRYVLVHQADPASIVRAAASYVRPGGTVAFQEHFVGPALLDLMGAGPLWRGTLGLLVSAFSGVMQHPDVGARLVGTFHAAGLEEAAVFCDMPVDASPASRLFPWLALTARSLLPVMERTGAVTAAALDADSLEDRLRAEAAALHSQVAFAPQFCAWARKG